IPSDFVPTGRDERSIIGPAHFPLLRSRTGSGQEVCEKHIWGIPPNPHSFGFAQDRLQGFTLLDSPSPAAC
ncbi:MAG: hypothetical protein AAB303_07320, partial [Chloroflexota bacterium]